MKLKLVFFSILLATLFSCTTVQDRAFQRVEVEQYYRPAGMVRYFLSDLPAWANASYEANCIRDNSKKYLKLNYVMKSFSLSYEEAIHLQAIYNDELEQAHNKKKMPATLKEEEGLFFSSIDKVKAGLRAFKKPTYKRVNIIWVDSFISKMSKLKKLMNSSQMNLGRPILLSMCYGENRLKQLLKKSGVVVGGSRFITFEFFSHYNVKGEFGAREAIDIDSLMLESTKKYFYYKGQMPKNINGKLKSVKIP